ncbi:MAG: sigma-70 family RNA polymerase sigma factor [Desulfobacteraceae bacterium]|nr:sigma-70 family RNA polymerase sigma factor [Desulfobacteraceae bacterium]
MPWDEPTLVAGLQSGDEAAYRELIRCYRDKLYRIAYGITLDEEESRDIIQDVFLLVFRKISKFKGESKLTTWLHRITVNQCLNLKRRWKRRFRRFHHSIETDDAGESLLPESEDYQAETLYRRKEVEEAYRNALRTLPEEARIVYVLKEIEGLTYEEIGRALGILKGTVSSRLFHARRCLKVALEPYRRIK